LPRVCRSLGCFLGISVVGTLSLYGIGRDLRCVTDRLDGAFVPGGSVVVLGWAADFSEENPVRKVEVRLDSKKPGEAQWGGWRPDVMAHFSRPDFVWAGWSATISFDDVSPGSHSVEAFAVSHDGHEVSCGRHSVMVRPIPAPPERAAWRIGLDILWRTVVFLLWLTFLGVMPARVARIRPTLLAAPLLGLCVFAVACQAGAALHVRPLASAGFLTFSMAVAGVALGRGRPGWLSERPLGRPHAPSRKFTLTIVGAAVVFMLIGVVPLASHGEGAVLGEIDDAVRECTAADAVARFGWNTPAEQRGYLTVMRMEMEHWGGRRGITHVLAALAQLFGERAHAVHSAANLAVGCLVVLGTGLLSFHVLTRSRRLRAVPAALVAVNSVVVATLYGQHLGSLVAAGLFLLFLASILTMARSRRFTGCLPVALSIAAAWSLYAEVLPAWAVAAALSFPLPQTSFDRKRLGKRYAAALLGAIVLNPVGLALLVRAWTNVSREPTLATSSSRIVVGDTHYFPTLPVIGGLIPYRQDAPAPLGRTRAILVPVATVLTLLVCGLSWRCLSRREKRIVLVLLAPIALALLANRHLNFPYGYAKILPLAAPVWSVSFALLVRRAAESPIKKTRSRVLSYATLALAATLAIPSVRHVLQHARLRVPAYDPAFRSLPALAGVVGPTAVFRIPSYPVPVKLWALYFLGDNAVDLNPTGKDYPGSAYFRIHDRRLSPEPAPAGSPSTRYFSLVPLPKDGS
jgi:hypothetical protein